MPDHNSEFECPECGSPKVAILASVWINYEEDGAFHCSEKDFESVDPRAAASCYNCGHDATVAEFDLTMKDTAA